MLRQVAERREARAASEKVAGDQHGAAGLTAKSQERECPGSLSAHVRALRQAAVAPDAPLTPDFSDEDRRARRMRADEGFERAEGLTDIRVSFRPANIQRDPNGADLDEQEVAKNFEVLTQFWAARTQFGLARIKLGAFLHLIKEHKLWRGVSDSWDEFIAQENVNPNAARQYITVAKQFVFDMDLPQETMAKLSLAGMTALERAAKRMTPENQAEMVAVLSELSERDAIQRVLEIAGKEEPKASAPSSKVLWLLREVHEMPPDMQFEFKSRLMRSEEQRKERRDLDRPAAPRTRGP